jgi:hypothetical protein
MEFDPGVFSLNFDMEAAVNEGKLIRRGDPNSVVREGEQLYFKKGELPGIGALKNINPNSVVREGEQLYFKKGEIPEFAMGGETNGLEELSRMRFRQQGSPMMGEQVDAGNVGILDGFNEQQASAMIQEGEQSRAQIDGAQDYDELMKSTRGDNASEEERRDELAQIVGEEDAQQTPDSVLALIQPVMQMLETEAADTGIAQVEGQNMPPEMMGTGIAQFAEGGAVLKIPKYSNGTDSFGVSNQPNIEQSNQSDDTDQYPETANFLLNMADDIIGNSLSTKNQAIMDKYEDNYKLFSEILGGQGPSKDQMIGDILTSVVSPLAFAYAQGADLKDILPQGTAAIGKIAKNYDALSSKQESQIKNLALTEAMKTSEDPLMQVYLRDDPETPDVNESLQKVFRKTSEVLANPDAYTAESIAELEARIGKTTAETDKLKTENAILEVESKYADIMANKEIEHKDSLIDSVKINNAIQEVVLEFKPELLTQELNKINLTNIEQGIRNDTLRPKLEAELETTLVQLDIAEENLKQEIITTKYADQLKGLEGDMLQAEIDKLEQEYDFNTDNNYLLLKEKEAQIQNLQLTGQQIDLENEYKVLENKFAEEEFSLENEALLLDNINKRLENTKLSISNAYLPTEKKLGIDKIKLDMELLNENISGQMLQNEKTLLDLNNYDEKTFLEFQKQKREIEKLEYELANPTKDWSEIKVQAEMRNKWNLSPMTVNMRDKQGFMQNLVSNAGENTGAGDLSFIFQYMKMLDPRSVVREGEFETAKRTGGIPASVWAAYEGIKNGRLLSAQVKADFLSAASKMYIQELENYNAELETYRGIASANGLDPELTIPSMNLDQELIQQLNNVNKINDSLSIINDFNLQDSVLPNVSDGRIKIPNLINK